MLQGIQYNAKGYAVKYGRVSSTILQGGIQYNTAWYLVQYCRAFSKILQGIKYNATGYSVHC